MPDVPNPAAVPGILPDIERPEDDLPPEADRHFGNDDANDAKTPVPDDKPNEPGG